MCACLDGVAALRTSSGAYCFKCLGWDHAEVVVQEPSSCIECQALPLQCDESETELVIKGVETATIKCPTPPPFITQAETKASLPKDDDITSVSVISTSHGSAAPTSVRWDFPQVLTIAAGHVGLPLAPLLISKPVIFGRGFTVCQTPCKRRLFHLPSLTFVTFRCGPHCSPVTSVFWMAAREKLDTSTGASQRDTVIF